MDNSTTLRQALTRELLRAQDNTNMRGQQAASPRETPRAVTSAMVGANDVTGIFMAEVSPVDGGSAYE